MGLFLKFINQTRKPKGFLGKMMVNRMNGGGHVKLANWGMMHLKSYAPNDILEIGCGGGRNVGELLRRYPASTVTAIDYSEVSVEQTTKLNADAIKEGRCTVEKGDVSNLTLPEDKYDLATAFETIYFWPGLDKCFEQVVKVLKPGGIFMVVNESDGMDEEGLKFEKIIDGMKCYTAEDIKTAMKNVGFSKVKSVHHQSKPWITVLAKK